MLPGRQCPALLISQPEVASGTRSRLLGSTSLLEGRNQYTSLGRNSSRATNSAFQRPPQLHLQSAVPASFVHTTVRHVADHIISTLLLLPSWGCGQGLSFAQTWKLHLWQLLLALDGKETTTAVRNVGLEEETIRFKSCLCDSAVCPYRYVNAPP